MLEGIPGSLKYRWWARGMTERSAQAGSEPIGTNDSFIILELAEQLQTDKTIMRLAITTWTILSSLA